MLTFHSEDTKKRQAKTELHAGELVAPFECPERVDIVIDRVRKVGLGEIRSPDAYGLDPVLAVHDRRYIEFLENACDDWAAAGFKGEPIPSIWPTRRLRDDVIPANIDGRIGYYALAAETSLCLGTFAAAQASKDIALSALDHVMRTGEPAFGLCRPPGHHAAVDQFGGYCFFNNAAIAAQHALNNGMKKVAILDIDFHHGNGTQDIFYERDDVLFLSLHGDPRDEFPYFLGFADETGRGKGEGFNVNYPLPSGTDYATWASTLDDAIQRIAAYQAEILIVSLGVDTFENDPISSFKLKSEDYIDCGRRLKALGIPTTFLLEGGYAVEEIGINTVNVLTGFEGT
ncbi:Acetoin utilization deacetylase AcuC [Modicisalibacter muralis]|uniref:Acetoin utilization deacetylase AcuC n=1 Tax=Modicisalibacter muralis TaxID=119000 RepID=A0A1G9RRI1_9GAMM|nr:histone deacetylase family protein [Halomonas muralis]SDM25919.1 Acetoin utilization deacetylase AcuC [Halomonas muralis]